MQAQRTISPVDGRVLVERPLAAESAVAAALERAGQAFASWRTTPVEQRIAVLNRAIDLLVAKRDELATEITWQMGRPIAPKPGRDPWPGGARPLHAGGGAPGAGRRRVGAKAGLHPVHPPRAAGAGVRHGALELPLPHRGQQHRPGSGRRQHRAAQALGPDAACAPSASRRRSTRPAAGRRVPASAPEPRGGARDRRERCGELVGVHRLGAGGRRAVRRPPGSLHRPPTSSSAARTRPMSAHGRRSRPRDREPGRRRLLQLRPKLLRHRADLRPRAPSTTRSSRAMSSSPPDTCSATRRIPTTTLGPMVRAPAADFARGQVDEAVAQGRARR